MSHFCGLTSPVVQSGINHKETQSELRNLARRQSRGRRRCNCRPAVQSGKFSRELDALGGSDDGNETGPIERRRSISETVATQIPPNLRRPKPLNVCCKRLAAAGGQIGAKRTNKRNLNPRTLSEVDRDRCRDPRTLQFAAPSRKQVTETISVASLEGREIMGVHWAGICLTARLIRILTVCRHIRERRQFDARFVDRDHSR
jgi:hypothetical protein